MTGLSKSKLLAHRQCPRRLWLETYRPELAEVDAGTAARFTVGEGVGGIARNLHAGGLLIEGETLRDVLALTRQALQCKPRRPLFEATLEHDKVLVRADLLLPAARGYRLVEVKSSTRVKEVHYPDAAVQAWVLRGAGLKLASVEVAHVDTSFEYPGNGDYNGLLAYVDVTPETDELAAEVPAWLAAARKTLRQENEPDIEPGEQCSDPYDCPFLGHCAPETLEEADGYPPEILPYGDKLPGILREEGYDDLRDVPRDRLDKPLHQRVWQASVTGKAFLDPQVKAVLQAYAYPRYFFDFETIQYAVPIWAGSRPYQQVPFQWSCHREDKNGTLKAEAFLAPDAGDPRRACAESLLKALGTEGPIFTYSAQFERGRIAELAAAFPDLEAELDSVHARIVDLLPIAREHYYHPDMRGSWSIKKVLPTVAPDLSYEDLAVGDGGMAQEAYAEMIDPGTSENRRGELRAALLEYCGQDTLALVRLSRFFEGR